LKAKLFDKVMNLLLIWDGACCRHFLRARVDGSTSNDSTAKCPDYKGLYCDLLGRSYAPELARQI
jgi:hypothetical protein